MRGVPEFCLRKAPRIRRRRTKGVAGMEAGRRRRQCLFYTNPLNRSMLKLSARKQEDCGSSSGVAGGGASADGWHGEALVSYHRQTVLVSAT